VILLVCSWPLYEFITNSYLVNDLVEIACKAIFYGTIPPVEHKTCVYYKAKEKKRLQMEIANFADLDRTGSIDEEEKAFLARQGIAPEEIFKTAVKADMDMLAGYAKQLSLIPSSYSTKEMRLQAFYMAQAETSRYFSPMQKEVFAIIKPPRKYFFPYYTEEQIAEIQGSFERESDTWKNITEYGIFTKRFWNNGLNNFLFEFSLFIYPFWNNLFWFLSTVFFASIAAS
jgi:hypothetical protein